MRTILLPLVLATGLSLPAQDATLSVLHGIPGLPAPVDVVVDGNPLFSFDFAELQGPLSLAPGNYVVDVVLQGNVVLNATLTLEADKNYTAVAHLLEGGGIALSAFENDVTSLGQGDARVTARHLADAPAVDVVAQRVFRAPSILFGNVSNGQEGTADVPAGLYRVSLEAAGTGTRAFGPEWFRLRGERHYVIYAIGALGQPSFQLFAQVIDLTATPTLAGSVQGSACAGAVGLSTTAPQFDQAFDVTLTGGTPDGFGFFHIGRSDARFLLFRLPIEIDFLGAQGCFLYQSTEFVRPIQLDANGDASYSVTIPSRYASWFDEQHYQFSFVAPGLNAAGFALSDYATVRAN